MIEYTETAQDILFILSVIGIANICICVQYLLREYNTIPRYSIVLLFFSYFTTPEIQLTFILFLNIVLITTILDKMR